MKDLTEKEIREIITAEFDLFNKRAFAAMDKLVCELNHTTANAVQSQSAKAISNGQVPNLTKGWSALAGLYVTLRTAFPELYKVKKN